MLEGDYRRPRYALAHANALASAGASADAYRLSRSDRRGGPVLVLRGPGEREEMNMTRDMHPLKAARTAYSLGLAVALIYVGPMTSVAGAQVPPVPTIVEFPGCSVLPKTCQFVVKPSAWNPTNDGSYNVSSLHWGTWTANYATGTAEVSSRTCWEACHRFATFPAVVLFTDPVTYEGHRIFARADVISLDPADAGQDMYDRDAAPQFWSVPKQANEWTRGRQAFSGPKLVAMTALPQLNTHD
jgi:hypothetical protein